jgi:hypothetical protein
MSHKHFVLGAIGLLIAGAAALLFLGRGPAAPELVFGASDVVTVAEDPVSLAGDAGLEGAAADGRVAVEPDGAAVGREPGEVRNLRITGRVVTPEGRPLPDAEVRLELARGGPGPGPGGNRQRVRTPIVTGADGRFAFAGPGFAPARVELHVRHPGYAPSLTDHELAAGARELDVGDLAVVTGGSIVGQITDPQGVGIAGALAELRPVMDNRLAWSALRETVLAPARADESGWYRFERVMPGSYRIAASARGRQRGQLRATVRVQDRREERVPAIVLGPGFVITGTVYAPDGTPLAEARVAASGGEPRIDDDQRTNREGRFEFAHLPGGELRFEVRAEGFVTWRQEAVDPAVTRDLLVRLEPGLAIEATVTDAETGAPVVAFAAKARRLGPLPSADNDAQRIRTELERFAEARRQLPDNVDVEQLRRLEGRLNELQQRVGAAGSARESMVRAWGGERIPDDLGEVARHPDGRIRFGGLDEGVYVVDVRSPEHQALRSETVQVKSGSPTPALALALPRGALVRGVVLAAADRRPLADARVELLVERRDQALPFDGPPGGEAGARMMRRFAENAGPRGNRVADTRTGATGSFTFAHQARARYFVTVRLDGFATGRTEVFELAADRTDLEILLQPTATIRGEVRGIPAGRTGEAHVAAFAGFGNLQQTRVADDGTYELKNVEPGSYLVRAFVGDFRMYAQQQMGQLMARGGEIDFDLTIAAGQELRYDVVVDLPKVGTVEGTVLNNGAPAVDLRVVLRSADAQAGGQGGLPMPGRGLGAEIDQRGEFTIQNVPAGDYELLVQAGGRSRGSELYRERVVVAADATVRVTARVTSTTLHGTVTAADGSPDTLDGEVLVLPNATSVPADVRVYGRTNPVYSLRVRDGSFESALIPPGPALVVVRIRGRAEVAQPAVLQQGEARLELKAGAKNP